MDDTPESGRARLVRGDHDGIAEAAALIRAGRLVAFPTETVYGLGADATSDTAVAAVFAAKGRPSFNPLIVHIPDAAAADRLVIMDERAHRLAAAFWPGALTLVLPRRVDAGISLLVSAGLDTLAVRVPAQPLALDLLRTAARPIAAPSANRSGAISPTTARHVLDGLADALDVVIEGGPCPVGLESAVVDLSGDQPVLLRPGGLAAEAIETIVGPLGRPDGTAEAPRSPGMLSRHYAPGRPVRLDATAAASGEALIGFGPDAPADCLNLSPVGDLTEAAANLFAYLRRLDRPDVEAIAVMSIPERGLGAAINDRLRRAAAPR